MRGGRVLVTLGALSALGACASTTASAPAMQRSAHAYANFLVGRVADLRHDHQAASDRLYAALADDPGDLELYRRLVEAALASGDFDRAEEVARRAALRRADCPYGDVLISVEALADGRWRAARQAAAHDVDDPGQQLLRQILTAWAIAGGGDTERAAGMLDQSGAPYPYDGLFASARALVFDAADASEAGAAYATSAARASWLAPALIRQSEYFARHGDSDGAHAALAGRDGRFANAALNAAARRFEAGASPRPAPSVQQGAALSLYALALIFAGEGDDSAALATLTLSKRLDPSFDAADLARADIYVRFDQASPARAALDSLSPTSDFAENAATLRAALSMRDGDSDSALLIAQQAADGGSDRAQRGLADLYRSLARYGDAEPIYSHLIDSSGDHPDWKLYFSRGVVRERLGRWPEAEADLQQALQISPDQPDVLNYLGYTWIDRGEHLQEGLALIERAVRMQPNSGAIIDSLGWAYFRMGQFDRALDLLEEAVTLSPADPVLNDHLGDAYWRAGRTIEAQYQWRRALSLEPAQSQRADLEGKLQRGLPPAGARSASR